MSSVEVKVLNGLSGFSLAHLRGEDRVDDDDVGGGAGLGERVGEREGPGLGGGLRGAVGGVGAAGRLRLGGGDQDEAPALVRERVVEGAGGVLERCGRAGRGATRSRRGARSASGSPPFQPPTRWRRASTRPKRSVRASPIRAPRRRRGGRRRGRRRGRRAGRGRRRARRAGPGRRRSSASVAPSAARRAATVGPRPPAAPAIATIWPSSRSRSGRSQPALRCAGRASAGVQLRLELRVEEARGGTRRRGRGRRAAWARRPRAGRGARAAQTDDSARRHVRRRRGRGRRSTGRASSGRCRSGRAPGRARGGRRRRSATRSQSIDEPVVGPVQVALAVQEGEQELAAEAVVVADAVAGEGEAEEAVEEDRVLDVAGEGEAVALELRRPRRRR